MIHDHKINYLSFQQTISLPLFDIPKLPVQLLSFQSTLIINYGICITQNWSYINFERNIYVFWK